jgi:NitT/TauT family transport system substrate-binding protein
MRWAKSEWERAIGRLCGVVLFGAFLVLFDGCRPEMKSISSSANRPLRIAINVWPGYASAFLAKERGWFEKFGVEVELVLNQEIEESYRQFDQGEVDGCFGVLSDVVMQESRHSKTKVVFAADYSMSGDVIVGKGAPGDLSGLKGKTIGHGGLNTFSHVFVIKALEQAGIDELDVTYRSVPAHEVFKLLESGEIDAGHTWEPTATEATEKGYHRLGSAADVPGLIADVLMFSPKVVEERAKEVEAVIKALIASVEELILSPDQGIQIMAQATGMTEAEMRTGLEGVKLLDLSGNIGAFQRNSELSSLYHSVAVIGQFLMERGQVGSAPIPDRFLEPRFIKELAYKNAL